MDHCLLPHDIFAVIARQADEDAVRGLLLTCRDLYELLVPLFYRRAVQDYPHLCERIVTAIRFDVDEEAIIRSLKRAERASARFDLFEETDIEDPSPTFVRSGRPTRALDHQSVYCSLMGLAAFFGYQEVISFLHQQGLSDDAVEASGASAGTKLHSSPPLFVALARGHHEAATRLLSLGASPALRKEALDQQTALHLAAALPYPDIIERIVQMGAAINSRDENGDTALVYAVASRTSTREIIALLAKLGADVNHMTSFRGQDTSLLGLACALEHWELADELLDREADANGGTREWQIRPLEVACGVWVPEQTTQARQSRRALVTKLLQRGANPNIQRGYNSSGPSFLAWLMENGCEWEAECLIHCPQINIEQVDGLGMTPIAHALSTHHGRPALAKLLLDKGAQPPDVELEDIRRVAQRVLKDRRNREMLLRQHPKIQELCAVLLDYYTNRSPEGHHHDATITWLRQFCARSGPRAGIRRARGIA
ncbi:ankyrin repeat protein [Apiospora arundinis]